MDQKQNPRIKQQQSGEQINKSFDSSQHQQNRQEMQFIYDDSNDIRRSRQNNYQVQQHVELNTQMQKQTNGIANVNLQQGNPPIYSDVRLMENKTQATVTLNKPPQPISKHSPQFFSAQKMPNITINERSSSPNRYYYQGQAHNINNKLPTTQTIITFGPTDASMIQRNESKIFPTTHQNVIVSRIISQRQGQPIAHLPPYLRDREFKEQVTLIQSPITQRQQLRTNPSSLSTINTSRLTPRITFNTISSNNVITQRHSRSPQLSQPPQPPQPPQVYQVPQIPQYINPIPQMGQRITQPINIIKQQNIIRQASQITLIYTQFHSVTEQIRLLINGQADENKKIKIRQLVQLQTQLEQKLKKLLSKLELSEKQNFQLKSHIKMLSSQLEEIQVSRVRNSSQVKNITDPRIEQYSRYIQKLQGQNKNISQSFFNIRQQTKILQKSSQQYIQLIQSQKKKIQTLQSQLSQINNQPVAPISANSSPSNINLIESASNPANTNNNSVNNSQRLQSRQNMQEITTQLQNKYKEIVESKDDYINQLQSDNLRIKTQLSNLKKQINKQRSSLTISGDESSLVNSIERYKNFQGSTEKLGNIIIQKEEQIMILKQEQEQYDKVLQQKDEKIKQLYQQITVIKENKLEEQKMIDNQRQLCEEVQQLKSQIKVKNQQLYHFQEEIKKYTDLHIRLQELFRQNQSLRTNISDLQSKLQATTTPTPTPTSVIVQQNGDNDKQIQLLGTQLKKKQSENIKLKGTIQSNFKSIESLQNFTAELQNKFKFLQDQINDQRAHSIQRQGALSKRIQQLQSLQVQYKNKQEKLQKAHQDNQNQITTLRNEIDQLKKKINTEIKQQTTSPIRHKDSQISQNLQDFRLNYSQSQAKIFQLQTDLKTRQHRIKNLQNELRQKQDIKSNQQALRQQNQMLKRKIRENEQNNKVIRNNMANSNININKVDHVFQQKVIYQLQKQIETLKSRLSMQQIKEGYAPSFNKTKKPSKSDQVSLLMIQKRLFQFNSKLQNMIQTNKDLQIQGNNYSNSFKFAQNNRHNLQIVNLFQRQKAALFRRHYDQIKSLQTTIADLQAYCSSLQSYNESMTFSALTVTQARGQEKNIYSDQIVFFRQKNKELEERVNFLMELSKNLKEKLQSSPKQTKQGSLDYYKSQVNQLQNSITENQYKIKRVTQEKNNLMKQLQKLRKDDSYLISRIELQKQIKQLKSENSRLQQSNKMLEIDIKKYLNQTMLLSNQSLNHKTGLNEREQKLNQLQYNIERLAQKIKDDEQTIANLMNQNQILKSQMTRLHQFYQTKKKQSDNMSQNIAARNFQLRQNIGQLQLEIRIKNSLIEEYEHKLKSQTSNLASSYLKYQSPNISPINSRIRDLEIKMGEFQQTSDRLSKQNYDLKLILEQKDRIIAHLNMINQQPQSKNHDLSYQIQLIRSILIEIDNLISELNPKQDERQRNIISRIKQQINMNLQVCSRMAVRN